MRAYCSVEREGEKNIIIDGKGYRSVERERNETAGCTSQGTADLQGDLLIAGFDAVCMRQRRCTAAAPVTLYYRALRRWVRGRVAR